MHIEFIDSINQISAASWNAVAGVDYPFTRHEFLLALELSGATNRDSGWQPHHMLIYQEDDVEAPLIAVMPLYLKYHSYGEYVFDWSWADAYRRNGVAYYPKLLAAIPYTPATGPRLCSAEGINTEALCPLVSQALQQEAADCEASSVHILFPQLPAMQAFEQAGLTPRRGVQFHWFNDGFATFDEFLARFSSRKRKNLNKERRQVEAQNLQLEVLEGAQISPELWQRFHHFYQMTYAKRSGHGGYLNLDFFQRVAETMPEHIVLVMATHEGQYVAGALNFRDSQSLYGRYWGCIKEFDYLHFEACYYQGIEYCIEHKLTRFDPGAQGEHKIQRGFTPIETWSNHWVAHQGFTEAIKIFLTQENKAMFDYLDQAIELLPFKK